MLRFSQGFWQIIYRYSAAVLVCMIIISNCCFYIIARYSILLRKHSKNVIYRAQEVLESRKFAYIILILCLKVKSMDRYVISKVP